MVFKLNADKNIEDYNLAKCRHITDDVDKTWLKFFGLSSPWEEAELGHTLAVRTAYENTE